MKKLIAFLIIATVIIASQIVKNFEIDFSEPYNTIVLAGFMALSIGLPFLGIKQSIKEQKNEELRYKKRIK